MYNPFSIRGKHILITGASSGIGRATAIECAKCGAELIITARNDDRLKETFDCLEGGCHQMIIADLNKKDDLSSIVEIVDKIDGLVLSAGINDKSLIKFLKNEHEKNMLDTNFLAPVHLTQILLKNKKISKEASIVFLSSIAAFFPSVANAMYASSKAALSQFAKVLALELMPQRIRVNCIEPAFVETDMVKKNEIVDAINAVRTSSPFGRLISPEEVAYAVIYFLSDATKLVTGSSLVMDGGFIIKR